MIRRRTPLKRSTKPIPRKRAKPRRGPLRDPGYLAFLREEGACAVALGFTGRWTHGPCEAAHRPVNGMRSKGPDNEAIPLCSEHHREQHQLGWRAFEDKHRINRAGIAAVWYAAYQIWKERIA